MALINSLGKVALGGFIACCSSYYLFQSAVSKSLINSDICKDVIEMVNNHNGAKQFLGEPIEATNAKFLSYGKDPVKSVQILVSGPKSKGKVFITISAATEEKKKVESIQLQIGADDSKRLEIKSQVVSAS